MGKAGGMRSVVHDFMRRGGIEAGMDQNLEKEAIHLHLLSALSDAGILRHVILQGGAAIRLCYGGERYSEDIDFVCGKAGSYVKEIDFDGLVERALLIAKNTLERDFGIDPGQITQKRKPNTGKDEIVAAWQINVPVSPTPNTPRSRIKIEFAHVPAHDTKAVLVGAAPGLVQIQDVLLNAETPSEILADKAVALIARPVLKFRDVWDVWFLANRLHATADRELVLQKFSEYGTDDVEARAMGRIDEMEDDKIVAALYDELSRFLPSTRVAQLKQFNAHRTMLSDCVDLVKSTVLPEPGRSMK